MQRQPHIYLLVVQAMRQKRRLRADFSATFRNYAPLGRRVRQSLRRAAKSEAIAVLHLGAALPRRKRAPLFARWLHIIGGLDTKLTALLFNFVKS